MARIGRFQNFPDQIRTARLLLRRWDSTDSGPFAAINADPRIMEYYPATLSASESDDLIARLEAHFETWGVGLYAVQTNDTPECIGFIGLLVPVFEAHFTPCVEIGWRLAIEHWGRGLATEGARAVLKECFKRSDIDEVVAMTSVGNVRSRRVMEKLNMKRNPKDDFDHPRVLDERLKRHMLYRIHKPDVVTESAAAG